MWSVLIVPDDAEIPHDLDALFLMDDSQERVCGREACPVTSVTPESPQGINFTTDDTQLVFLLPCKTSAMLASVFLGCSVMGVALTAAFLDRIRMFVYQDPLERPTGVAALRAVRNAFRDPRLQLAAPLAVFIGMEQGFMLADFSKVSVVRSRTPSVVGPFTANSNLSHCCSPVAVLCGVRTGLAQCEPCVPEPRSLAISGCFHPQHDAASCSALCCHW